VTVITPPTCTDAVNGGAGGGDSRDTGTITNLEEMTMPDDPQETAPEAAASPADRPALREEIAEALMCWAERHNNPQYGPIRRPGTVTQNAYGRADAVLAVIESRLGERAALIREVIERLETRARQAPAPGARLHSFRDVARVLIAELHDMADEAPLSRFYSHEECGFHWHGRDGLDIPMRDGEPICPRCELERLTAAAEVTT
jgi:nucleotide-binding universal stress UspA family protein